MYFDLFTYEQSYVPTAIEVKLPSGVVIASEDSLDSVLIKKYEFIAKTLNTENVYADEFFDASGIDFAYTGHSADTGVMLCELLPFGEVKLTDIAFDEPVSSVKCYIEGDVLVEYFDGNMWVGMLQTQTFSAPVEVLQVRLRNTTDVRTKVRAFALFW